MTHTPAAHADPSIAQETPTVAEAIAATLHDAGVRYVFGLPGGETLELLDALRRRDIEFILVHNEASAVFMADAYARSVGTIGVCMTTLGPGATNVVVGVGHAYLDRAPVLVFTAQKPENLLPDYTHQVLDLHALYRPITKATRRLHAGNIYTEMASALALTRAGRPGPVHLQISNEDAGQPVQTQPEPQDATATETRAEAPSEALNAAAELLAQARRPLIIAGLGLEPASPYALLRECAEALDAPVVVTPKAKGALPDEHPLAAGVIGLTRTDPAYVIVDEADCILAVGFDVVELVRPWATEAPLIWVAPWANEDPVLPAAHELTGDLNILLDELTNRLYAVKETTQHSIGWGSARVSTFHATLQRTLPDPAPDRLLPQQVLAELRQRLPRHAAMAVDVGSHKIHSSLEWPTLQPNTFFLSNGLSSMGFGLPAAIGLALADPTRPAVCLTGDAGMAMVMGELAVLKHRHLPVLVLVLNDAAIDLIRSQQRHAGKPVYGTEFEPPDFTAIAGAYGLTAQRITGLEALGAFIDNFLADPGPYVAEIMLDPTTYPTTPAEESENQAA